MPHVACGWAHNERMPHPAYTRKSGHQARRKRLLAQLRMAGGAICVLCGQIMTADMELHLHHSDPAAKQMGLPGDTLVHGFCNMSEGGRRNGKSRKDPPQRKAAQSREW